MNLLSLPVLKNRFSIFASFRSRQSRLKFLETYEFSPGLQARFGQEKDFLDASQRELVFTALRDYFCICHHAQKNMVSMPSQIVDDAWHDFILFTREYNEFCLMAFGRYLHHTPAEAMESPTKAQQGIRRTWKIACKRANINPDNADKLPLIFAIDDLLNIENGFKYSLDCLSGNRNDYCATHIGCSSGCGGDSGGSGDSSDCGDGGSADGGCGGGCGGD